MSDKIIHRGRAVGALHSIMRDYKINVVKRVVHYTALIPILLYETEMLSIAKRGEKQNEK